VSPRLQDRPQTVVLAVVAGGALTAAEDQRHRALLEAIVDGRTVATWAHAEPSAGYDLARVTTTVTPSGGGWTLEGVKVDVDHGATADHILVSARTGSGPTDEDGLSLFVVARDTPGLVIEDVATLDGTRASVVRLHGVSLPANAIVGAPGRAYPVIETAVGRGVLAVCAEALGTYKPALEGDYPGPP
jgi:alkylation response protein AidB-like acyl-CoA dehydrogenase